MLKVEKNLVVERNMKRIDSLSEKGKKAIEELNKKWDEEKPINFIKLKRSKEIPKVGDVFVFSCKKGEYMYGKVLETFFYWGTYCQVVIVFNDVFSEKNIENFNPSYKKLFIPPQKVFIDYWKQGLFETIGNIPITNEEKNLDYGFFDMDPLKRFGYFVDAKDNKLDYIPENYSQDGICTIWGLYMKFMLESIFLNDNKNK